MRQLILIAIVALLLTSAVSAQTTRPEFLVYDATFGIGKMAATVPGCRPVFWASPAVVCPWHRFGNKFIFDPTERDMISIAAKVRDGGYLNLGAQGGEPKLMQVPKGAMTFLDFETAVKRVGPPWKLVDFGPDDQARLIRAFKAEAPSMISAHSIELGPVTHEQMNDPTPQQRAILDADAEKKRAAVDAADVVMPCIYMLGPKYVDRDIRFISRSIEDFKKYFPGKRIIPVAWGAYHTSWNKANSVIPDEILNRMIDECVKSGADGMLVWGEYADNKRLIELALQRVGP